MNNHIFLVHWIEAEAEVKATALCDLGWQVDLEAEDWERTTK